MSQETTYLELSEVDGAHKFYEVIVDNATLTVRYGRIGDQGQVKASAYPDNARARAAAAKKIGEKVRKGYAPAVPGVRQKRTVSRRQIVSTRSTAHTAPGALALRLRRPRLRHLRRRAALHGRQRARRHHHARPRRPGAQPGPPSRRREVHRRRRRLDLRRLRRRQRLRPVRQDAPGGVRDRPGDRHLLAGHPRRRPRRLRRRRRDHRGRPRGRVPVASRPGGGVRPGWCGATTTPSTTATRGA